MKTKYNIILLFGLLIMLPTSCSREMEHDIMQSVFIEDIAYPGLPIYTEWGYNTFGAYIERSVFVSSNQQQPGKIILSEDSVRFMLSGGNNGVETTLTFNLANLPINTFEDLSQLDATTIDLTAGSSSITFKQGYESRQMPIIDGELTFKRVQKLYIDDEFSRFILSGTFRLKTFKNDEPITIHNGRFDMGIGYENFYKL